MKSLVAAHAADDKKSLIVMTAVLICFAVARAPSPAGAQALPRPGEPHELLKMDAGTWDGEVKMYFGGPAAPPAEFKSVEVNELVSGDLYLRTKFSCEMGDAGPFEGHSLLGFDPRTEQYTGTWVDNFTAAPTQLNGEYDAESRTLTIRSVVVDADGNELNQKQVTTWMDDATKKFEVFLIVETDGQPAEIKLMEMVAKKRQ